MDLGRATTSGRDRACPSRRTLRRTPSGVMKRVARPALGPRPALGVRRATAEPGDATHPCCGGRMNTRAELVRRPNRVDLSRAVAPNPAPWRIAPRDCPAHAAVGAGQIRPQPLRWRRCRSRRRKKKRLPSPPSPARPPPSVAARGESIPVGRLLRLTRVTCINCWLSASATRELGAS